MSQLAACPTVSVILVNFNTKDALRRALTSIDAKYEVIVVDNGSQDGSIAMVSAEFPQVKTIENQVNVGFGAANNQGIALASADFVLFLNSDAWVWNPEEDPIDKLAEVLSQPDVAAVGGKLLNPDGSLQESVAGPLTLGAVLGEQLLLDKLWPGLSGYWQTKHWVAKGPGPHKVHQVMGACLMTRKLERFDERIFLYCEDTELCSRLKLHGDILYVPEARFGHELGTSSRDNRWRSVALYNRGKEQYFEIRHGQMAARICRLFNRFGASIRVFGWMLLSMVTLGLKPNFLDQIRLWIRVLTAPRLGPPTRQDIVESPGPASPVPE